MRGQADAESRCWGAVQVQMVVDRLNNRDVEEECCCFDVEEKQGPCLANAQVCLDLL